MNRKLATAAALVIGLAAAACSNGSPAPTTPSAPSSQPSSPPSSVLNPPSGPTATLTQVEFHFDPIDLRMRASQGLVIQNKGTVVHNFTVLDHGIDIDVQPGASSTTEAIGQMLQPGTYHFVCKYHRDQGMIGVLIVVPG